ncbi:MAG: hypothetical protein WCN98_11815 [Verrucomicrobiaceae bacterium]
MRVNWRDVSVNIAGVDRGMADELAAFLALAAPDDIPGEKSDICVTWSDGEACVRLGEMQYSVSSTEDLFLLLNTLVPARLIEMVGVGRRMHSAGVRVGNGLLLLSGEGRIGKSSIMLEAWRSGLEILGDDWLLFSNDFTGMAPVPKPLKPRMTLAQFMEFGRPAHFGTLFGETRMLIGRGEGFYNVWDQPLPIGAVVFLESSDDAEPMLERIAVADALPLLLSQTILCGKSQTLAGIVFAKGLAARDIPVFRLRRGKVGPSATFAALLAETRPWF